MAKDYTKHKVIFITGASSGLGASLAKLYADKNVALGLLARRKENLTQIAQDCRAQGAEVAVYQADVADARKVTQAAQNFIKQFGHVDLVYANAGIGSFGKRNKLGVHEAMCSNDIMDKLFDVNVKGVYYTINAFIETFVKQRFGHAVIISSIAAYRPLPRSMYSASKIAVKYMADSYRMELQDFNINFSSIMMGFAKSELTDKNKFKMPFLMETDDAAQKVIRAVAKKKKNFTFPWQMKIIAHIMKRVPEWVIARTAKNKMKGKKR